MRFKQVLLAVVLALPLAAGFGHAEAGGAMDIVDTAKSAGSVNTLVAAVKAAGLADKLRSDGPYTLFAPSDDAFAALPEGTFESLLKPENRDRLIAVLTFHMVPGKILTKDLAGSYASVVTVHGGELDLEADLDVKVDNAIVLDSDILASNGVIHVIDRVVLPN